MTEMIIDNVTGGAIPLVESAVIKGIVSELMRRPPPVVVAPKPVQKPEIYNPMLIQFRVGVKT